MSDLNERFDAYHTNNPDIWKMFETFANQLVAAGVTTLSANRIFERMRWESDISGGDGYKLNNNYRPYYARMYEQVYPNAPKFKKRIAHADEVFS